MDKDCKEQLKLFTEGELGQATLGSSRRHLHQMTSDSLLEWKAKIFKYQQQARANVPVEQIALFEVAPVHCEPNTIDPFNLPLQSLSFWRLPTDGAGDACLYFVIDNALPLLLYVGETCRSNQRWKGVHDCKRYVENYQNLHYQHKMQTAVNIAFWWNAPVQTRPRQQLEQALIQTWRPPFNRESWLLWSAPFV